MVTVSAVVPATNGPPTLAACCEALSAGTVAPEQVVVVEKPAEANAARARNLGASEATGDVLLFVDSDVAVREDAVERIKKAFAADPTLVAVFGSYDDAPAAPGTVSAFRNLLHHHVHQESPGRATTFWTGLGAVRREAFEGVGGFDESVEMMEDIDLGMRLAAGGAKIELDPAIQGTHLKHWSLWGMVHTDFLYRGVPWVELLLRHRGSSTDVLNLGWRHRLSALAALGGAAAVAARRPAGALAAAVALVSLNRSFYALLLRRRGPAETAAGVGLHALHHLASIAAVPVGIWRHLRGRKSG